MKRREYELHALVAFYYFDQANFQFICTEFIYFNNESSASFIEITAYLQLGFFVPEIYGEHCLSTCL